MTGASAALENEYGRDSGAIPREVLGLAPIT